MVQRVGEGMGKCSGVLMFFMFVFLLIFGFVFFFLWLDLISDIYPRSVQLAIDGVIHPFSYACMYSIYLPILSIYLFTLPSIYQPINLPSTYLI